jgi:hypothetical protein
MMYLVVSNNYYYVLVSTLSQVFIIFNYSVQTESYRYVSELIQWIG